ncbi:hypothetical protein [Ruegeria sp. Ofav3-42]|uniref:hypothetical protein n=1 Tax=Ruegeria sp. Ofav3-42 TaxID=2917759 RepID=UPI001EF47267|nr:hypothetical protein [Ruegeria sp. Ofav3-42]MCG7519006.1 hypothetical protein [Ruegeria sp. Ofav3-42]
MTPVSYISGACLVLAISAQLGQAKSPIAEVICEPTSRMHDKLERQFGSQRAATGLRGPEQLMEVWTSDSGDWTMVVTYSSGTSCIVAMGQDWYTHADKKPARG